MNAPFPAVSAEYIIDLYHRYLCNPASVDPSWIPYFDDLYGPRAAENVVAAVTAEAAAVR
jgi:2-oxoglutarate dehydrogenase complex dehydrogenase (E1) component-like enzyme